MGMRCVWSCMKGARQDGGVRRGCNRLLGLGLGLGLGFGLGSGLCEVDPAVSGLCEVGPAETGLARSASCRSEGGLVLEPGRKGGCALLLGDGRETSGLKVCWHGPRAQWPRAPRPAFVCSAGVEVYLLLFSLSNTITSYGDRYPEGCTEESNFRPMSDRISVMISVSLP